MAFDLGKAFDGGPNGFGHTVAGSQVAALVSGSGSPLGNQAPLSTIYQDYTNGNLWLKTGAGVNDWTKVATSNIGGSFEFESFFEAPRSTTTSNGWVNKLSVTTSSRDGGKYYVGWAMEYSQTDKEKRVGTRVRINYGSGWVKLMDARNGVSVEDAWDIRSGFFVIDSLPAAPGGYGIEVDFGQTDDGGTAKVRNVGVIIYRISP